jgi:hypothetical protein
MGAKPFLLITGLVVALDQMTKALVLANMPIYHSIPVISGLFQPDSHPQSRGGVRFHGRRQPGAAQPAFPWRVGSCHGADRVFLPKYTQEPIVRWHRRWP